VFFRKLLIYFQVTLKSGLFLSGFEPMTFAPSVRNDLLVRLKAAGLNNDDLVNEQTRKWRTLRSMMDQMR